MADDIEIQTGVDIKFAFRGACIHPEGTIGAEPTTPAAVSAQRVIDEGELRKAGFATMGTGAFAEAALRQAESSGKLPNCSPGAINSGLGLRR